MMHHIAVAAVTLLAGAISLEVSSPGSAASVVNTASAVPLAQGLTAVAEGREGLGTDTGDPLFSDVPEFVSTNNTQTVKEGDSTVLSCQVNKLGSWQIIWHRRQTPHSDWKVLRVGATPVLIKADDPRYKFEGQSTVLRIDDVRPEDEGLYKCEIAVKNSPKIYVEVKVEPEANGDRTWSNAASVTASQISTLLVSLLLALCFV